MKILLVIIAVVAACVVLVVIIGYSLPVSHRASRMAEYAARPTAVFDAISGVEAYPTWRSRVKSVEIVALPNGGRGFREHGSDGTILYAIEDAAAPTRFVTRIADDKLPFGGTWTYAVHEHAGGTTLRITEDGEVRNPVFRFVSRFVLGHDASINTYLADLGKKFGATAVITD